MRWLRRSIGALTSCIPHLAKSQVDVELRNLLLCSIARSYRPLSSSSHSLLSNQPEDRHVYAAVTRTVPTCLTEPLILVWLQVVVVPHAMRSLLCVHYYAYCWLLLRSRVYSGPRDSSSASPDNARNVTLRSLMAKYAQGIPLTMVTAYDYPSAAHAEMAGIDMVLVGDSAGMVVQGHDTTLPVTLDEMITMCKSVCRGASKPFIVGDLPFGCFEASTAQAIGSSVRMLKEGGVDAVKVEGGFPARAKTISAISEAGIAVVGHVGLTPQSISKLGGFRPAGRTAEEAFRVVDEAMALQEAGCIAVVLECVPGVVAAAATRELSIPTIGIGSGNATSGQVLVWTDMLGFLSHPHHQSVAPKFIKRYADISVHIQNALAEYVADVESKAFPSERYTPYVIPDDELSALRKTLRHSGYLNAADECARGGDMDEDSESDDGSD
jgi:3-methyl-2-oxobutanoate hydroxymethyltransferase